MKILKTYKGAESTTVYDLLNPRHRLTFASSFGQEKEERYYFLQELSPKQVADKVNETTALIRFEAEMKQLLKEEDY